MAGSAPQPGHRQSNSHIIALLSVKILLLAFFILLNALASFEAERSRAAVESVREAFQGLLPAVRNVSATPAGVGSLTGTETIADSLKQLFGNDLPLVELPRSSGGRVLQVDLPAADLFDEAGALIPRGAETLRLLAGVLADPRHARQNPRVDVLYGLAGRASGLDGNRAALSRAGLVVRALEREGLAPARLSAGLLPALPDKVRLHVTIRAEPAAPADGGEAR